MSHTKATTIVNERDRRHQSDSTVDTKTEWITLTWRSLPKCPSRSQSHRSHQYTDNVQYSTAFIILDPPVLVPPSKPTHKYCRTPVHSFGPILAGSCPNWTIRRALTSCGAYFNKKTIFYTDITYIKITRVMFLTYLVYFLQKRFVLEVVPVLYRHLLTPSIWHAFKYDMRLNHRKPRWPFYLA